MIDNFRFGLRHSQFNFASLLGYSSILRAFFVAALVFFGPGLSHGASDSPTGTPDQQEIARIAIPIKIARPMNVSRSGKRAALAGGNALAQTASK